MARKIAEWRESSIKDLESKVSDLKHQLIACRSTPEDSAKIGALRHDIAVLMTVIREKCIAEAHAHAYAHMPKDLRARKTRALRRSLTKEQKARVVPRVAKMEANFPMKRFYLKH